jgi:ABC-type amino acid transport substrate-binding protein
LSDVEKVNEMDHVLQRVLSFRLRAFFILAPLATGVAMQTQPVEAAPLDKIMNRGVFEVCVSPGAEPYSELSKTGSPHGFHIDLGGALARELGVEPKFRFINFNFEARHTSCDAFMSAGVFEGKSEGRTRKSEPYLLFDTLLVTKPDRNIKSLDDLNGLRVAVQMGSLAHVTLLGRPVDIRVSMTRENDLLSALARDEIDAGVVTNIGYYWYLRNNPKSAFKAQTASILQTPTGYPIAIALRNADDKAVTAVNAAIQRLKQTGELLSIMKSWGLENVPIATP